MTRFVPFVLALVLSAGVLADGAAPAAGRFSLDDIFTPVAATGGMVVSEEEIEIGRAHV